MRFFSSAILFAVAAASFIVPSLADTSFSQFSQRSDLFDARDVEVDARDYLVDLEARDYDELERRSYVVAPGAQLQSYVNSLPEPRDVLDELVARGLIDIRAESGLVRSNAIRRFNKPKRDLMLVARDLVELLVRGGGADLTRSNAIRRPAGNTKGGAASSASTQGNSNGGKSTGPGAGGSKFVEHI